MSQVIVNICYAGYLIRDPCGDFDPQVENGWSGSAAVGGTLSHLIMGFFMQDCDHGPRRKDIPLQQLCYSSGKVEGSI